MSLTRKAFIARAALGAVAFAATTLAGAGTAEAGPQPHLRSVVKRLDKSSRQLDAVAAGWVAPPGPERPAVTAELQQIVADCAHMTAAAQRLLATLR